MLALLNFALFCALPWALKFIPVSAAFTSGDRYSALYWGGSGFSFEYEVRGRKYHMDEATFVAVGPEGAAGDMTRVEIYCNRIVPGWWRQFPPGYGIVILPRGLAAVAMIGCGLIFLSRWSASRREALSAGDACSARVYCQRG